MGETRQYQPLTRHDKVTVVLYRIGIVLATVSMAALGWAAYKYGMSSAVANAPFAGALLTLLFFSVGVSVYFIHLYVSRFHRGLKILYVIAALCFAGLFVLGSGNPVSPVLSAWYGPLLLLPLSGCLGFITAKEAFCFRLNEGYLIAIFLPMLLVLGAALPLSSHGLMYFFIFISLLLVLFTLRKVFQPLHYDIGDKSAYQ